MCPNARGLWVRTAFKGFCGFWRKEIGRTGWRRWLVATPIMDRVHTSVAGNIARSHLTRAAAAESGDGCGGGGTDLFALLTKSADAHWTSEAVGGPGGAAAARQQRAKRVIEIDRLASMPGDGLGGRLMRLSGAAMAATSSLAEVLVGPPEVFG